MCLLALLILQHIQARLHGGNHGNGNLLLVLQYHQSCHVIHLLHSRVEVHVSPECRWWCLHEEAPAVHDGVSCGAHGCRSRALLVLSNVPYRVIGWWLWICRRQTNPAERLWCPAPGANEEEQHLLYAARSSQWHQYPAQWKELPARILRGMDVDKDRICWEQSQIVLRFLAQLLSIAPTVADYNCRPIPWREMRYRHWQQELVRRGDLRQLCGKICSCVPVHDESQQIGRLNQFQRQPNHQRQENYEGLLLRIETYHLLFRLPHLARSTIHNGLCVGWISDRAAALFPSTEWSAPQKKCSSQVFLTSCESHILTQRDFILLLRNTTNVLLFHRKAKMW